MATQNIPNANISNVEAALIEQYGRTNIREKSRSEAQAQWRFRINNKAHGTCTATRNAEDVTLAMGPSTHVLVWIVTLLGFFVFVLPGIIMTIWIVVTRFITARVIGHRFPKMVENVKRVAASRPSQGST